MRKRSVSMKDVASRARVSIATVSHVINGTKNVSVERQNRVHEAMSALGYRPDGIARGLKTKKTRTIGILISDILNPFYPMIVRGVEDYVYAHGFSLVLCNTDEDLNKQSLYLNVLLEKRVDGIICTPAIGTTVEHLCEVDKMNIPIVLVDRVVQGARKHAVLTDNYEAAYQGTSHLINQGHKRILLVHGPLFVTTGRERYSGYVDAFKDHGLRLDPTLALQSNFKSEATLSMVRSVFSRERDRPTAIFSTNSLMTLGALQALRELELKVPQEVAILSFDDTDWFKFTFPSVTAISQPIYEMGREAAKTLNKLLNHQETARVRVLPSTLIVRDSTKSS